MTLWIFWKFNAFNDFFLWRKADELFIVISKLQIENHFIDIWFEFWTCFYCNVIKINQFFMQKMYENIFSVYILKI